MIASEESKNPEQTIETAISDPDDEDEPDKLIIVPFKSVLNEQNSFLNVIINSFFYKKEIMTFFETEEPPLQDSYRLIYELQSVFEQMRKLTSPLYFKKTTKERRVIDSSYIKHELRYQFNNKYFNPNQSGNASDVLNIFFNALHVYCIKEDNIIGEQTQKCERTECLAHDLAYVDIAEQIYCTLCKKKGTLYKYPFDAYYYPIDTTAILTKIYEGPDGELFINKLFELEKEVHDEIFQNNENDKFKCDCRRINKINFKNNLIMLQSHKYFTVSLLWNEPPKFEDICRIFITFPQRFKNTDLFHIYNDFDIKDYIMQGLIVKNNFNSHVSFFINDNVEGIEPYDKLEWYYCNESETKILSGYQDVIEWCLNNNYYPILLFYMYLDKDKIKEPKNIAFTEEQLNTYIHHCTLIDHMNAITYTNYKLKKETLHPNFEDIYVSNDIELYDKINDIKQDETKMNKKFNFVEELEKEKEKEALEEAIQKEEEEKEKEKEKSGIKHVKRPKNMDKFNLSKNDFIFKKSMESETFRKYPHNKDGNWVCSNCENINNALTFECVKCKFINMEIFARIDEERSIKNQEEEIKKNRMAKTYRNKSPKLKSSEYNQYTKKCLNCGNYYINKCYRCQRGNKNKPTFSQIRDENEMEQVKFVYNRSNKTVKNEKKVKAKNDLIKEWKCENCDKTNSGKYQFCVNCLKNK